MGGEEPGQPAVAVAFVDPSSPQLTWQDKLPNRVGVGGGPRPNFPCDDASCLPLPAAACW